MSKTVLIIIGTLVGAGMLYQIFERVPSDALNVALGVLCGIAAGLPVSIGLFVALTRQQRQNNAVDDWIEPEPEPAPVPRPQYPLRIPQNAHASHASQTPQIIVITPPQGQFAPGQFQQGFPFPAQWLNQSQVLPVQDAYMHEQVNAVDAREWRIIGEE